VWPQSRVHRDADAREDDPTGGEHGRSRTAEYLQDPEALEPCQPAPEDDGERDSPEATRPHRDRGEGKKHQNQEHYS